eukprot:2934570-Ditylum_brightwellii.AAC.1
MKGPEIKKIPSADSVLPPPGDDPMHVNLKIDAWLKNYPNWVDPDAALPPSTGKSPHAAA